MKSFRPRSSTHKGTMTDKQAPPSFALVIVGELPPDVTPELAQQMILPLFMGSLAIVPHMRSTALFTSAEAPVPLLEKIARTITSNIGLVQ